MTWDELHTAMFDEMTELATRFPDGIYPRDGSAPIFEMVTNFRICISDLDESALVAAVEKQLKKMESRNEARLES
jgi:hypothetical protein